MQRQDVARPGQRPQRLVPATPTPVALGAHPTRPPGRWPEPVPLHLALVAVLVAIPTRRRRVLRAPLRLALVAVLVTATVLMPATESTQAAPIPGACSTGMLPHGARSLICVPTVGWNGDLVVWLHGYVAPDQSLDFYHLDVLGGADLSTLVQVLGFAFATTSYRTNGLAVLEGVEDTRELLGRFVGTVGRPPQRTYVIGISEGALVATLLTEQAPELVSGTLALCGPIGEFQGQIEHFGDTRVLFDALFPGVLPGSPVQVPPEVARGWDQVYAPAIINALLANPAATADLVAAANLPIDPSQPATAIVSVLGALWYNVVGTRDLQARLGGNPYGNVGRQYRGSRDDAALNTRVQRIAADPVALARLLPYTPSGVLTRPLITMHTTGDPIVPRWHQDLYRSNAGIISALQLTTIPVARYGHCAFTAEEALGAFVILVLRVTTGVRVGLDPAQAGRLAPQLLRR